VSADFGPRLPGLLTSTSLEFDRLPDNRFHQGVGILLIITPQFAVISLAMGRLTKLFPLARAEPSWELFVANQQVERSA
jgi:hypothetical protein